MTSVGSVMMEARRIGAKSLMFKTESKKLNAVSVDEPNQQS
jgi:hypothetical protein